MTPVPSELRPVPGHMAKGQLIRLADVVAIGPLMFWFGYTSKRPPKALRAAMMVFGIGTVLYNGKNYLAVKQEMKAKGIR